MGIRRVLAAAAALMLTGCGPTPASSLPIFAPSSAPTLTAPPTATVAETRPEGYLTYTADDGTFSIDYPAWYSITAEGGMAAFDDPDGNGASISVEVTQAADPAFDTYTAQILLETLFGEEAGQFAMTRFERVTAGGYPAIHYIADGYVRLESYIVNAPFAGYTLTFIGTGESCGFDDTRVVESFIVHQ